MPHVVFIVFLFALGACVGSFLNVVVWRLPRGESIVTPPSHCPRCNHQLAWYDNIPVLGWIMLRGKCRYCGQPISIRYPTIEFIAGALFVFYYVMFFIAHVSPCAPRMTVVGVDLFGRMREEHRWMSTFLNDWPMYLLYMFMIASLLAASLIDAELFEIPLAIPWLMAVVGMAAHAIIDRPWVPGALNVDPGGIGGVLAFGGAVGLLISMVLFQLGVFPESFSDGEPALEVDEALYEAEVERAKREGREAPARPREYSIPEVRSEIRKEMLFLLPPVVGAMAAAMAVHYLPSARTMWNQIAQYHWVSGLLGSILGAMIGALMVWLARILGTLAMGRVAMGLGDVHLMFGIGAIVGAGPAAVAFFFIAPFIGLAAGLWKWVSGRGRELPYGPYLSIATGLVVLIYCHVADYLAPGLTASAVGLRSLLGM